MLVARGEGVGAKGRNRLVVGERKRCDEWECERGRDDGRMMVVVVRVW